MYTYQLSFSLSLYFMIFKNDKMSCQQMHFPMDANWFLLTEGVTHAAASFASAHATWEIPFGFLFQASMLVVLLCRSLIKILKVNQFVCLLPRGLSPFNPHFSKILKEVQFGNSYSNDIFGNLFKWNLFEMLCMLTEESIL